MPPTFHKYVQTVNTNEVRVTELYTTPGSNGFQENERTGATP